ncbi:unnamed protein product [Effrenium voratum]|nr:unnamed protein product [Effrenium voratum]
MKRPFGLLALRLVLVPLFLRRWAILPSCQLENVPPSQALAKRAKEARFFLRFRISSCPQDQFVWVHQTSLFCISRGESNVSKECFGCNDRVSNRIIGLGLVNQTQNLGFPFSGLEVWELPPRPLCFALANAEFTIARNLLAEAGGHRERQVKMACDHRQEVIDFCEENATPEQAASLVREFTSGFLCLDDVPSDFQSSTRV